jgi:hypothetical protein
VSIANSRAANEMEDADSGFVEHSHNLSHIKAG